MSLPSTHDVLSAAERLPLGATLIIHEFHWDDYEHLLEALGDRPGLRISYDSGKLEILSPSPRHDKYARFLDLLVVAFCEVSGLNCECYGQTTWKRKIFEKGVEPDACYYIKNANRVIGKRDLDLESDPPPDIAVEIDLTGNSMKKFSIYAALAVPEVWRYGGHAFTFYSLVDGEYCEISESRLLSALTGPMLIKAIEDCDTSGRMNALKAFRRKLRASR